MRIGYTFVDNSELSVSEKIKLYFEKNPPKTEFDSPNTSSSSIEFDASFAKLLDSKKQKSIKVTDEIIDLSTPPSTINTTISASPIWSTPSRRHHILNRSNNARNFSKNHVIIIPDSPDVEYISNYTWLNDDDESFLAHEKRCNMSITVGLLKELTTNESDLADESIKTENNNETQLFDIEEPSFFWNQYSFIQNDNTLSHMSPMKTYGLNRPSTIIEESTIKSENSIELCSTDGRNISTGAVNKIYFPSGDKAICLNSSEIMGAEKIPSLKNANKLIEVTKETITYRPSYFNLLPKKKHIFYPSESPPTTTNKEKSYDFENVTRLNPEKSMNRASPLMENQQLNETSFHTKYRQSYFNLLPRKKHIFYPSDDDGLPMRTMPVSNKITQPDLIDIMHINSSRIINSSFPLYQGNSSDSSIQSMTNFNDTIDAMDFYIKKGQMLQS